MTNHYRIEDGIRIYSLNKSMIHLEKLGKHHFGEHFRLYAEDKDVIYKLLIYAIYDKENCAHHKIDLNKGILLTGPIGCGKTSLMYLLRYFMPPEVGHVMKTSRDVAFEYKAHGHQIIRKHCQGRAIFCFDDLGIEQPIKHYGNTCNVMAEILLSRYDLFTIKGIRTHATTNLNASELEEFYGNRVRSRMREMFNLIAFDKSTGDKRK